MNDYTSKYNDQVLTNYFKYQQSLNFLPFIFNLLIPRFFFRNNIMSGNLFAYNPTCAQLNCERDNQCCLTIDTAHGPYNACAVSSRCHDDPVWMSIVLPAVLFLLALIANIPASVHTLLISAPVVLGQFLAISSNLISLSKAIDPLSHPCAPETIFNTLDFFIASVLADQVHKGFSHSTLATQLPWHEGLLFYSSCSTASRCLVRLSTPGS